MHRALILVALLTWLLWPQAAHAANEIAVGGGFTTASRGKDKSFAAINATLARGRPFGWFVGYDQSFGGPGLLSTGPRFATARGHGLKYLAIPIGATFGDSDVDYTGGHIGVALGMVVGGAQRIFVEGRGFLSGNQEYGASILQLRGGVIFGTEAH